VRARGATPSRGRARLRIRACERIYDADRACGVVRIGRSDLRVRDRTARLPLSGPAGGSVRWASAARALPLRWARATARLGPPTATPPAPSGSSSSGPFRPGRRPSSSLSARHPAPGASVRHHRPPPSARHL